MLNFSGVTTVLPNHNPSEGRVIWNNNFTHIISELENLEATLNTSNELISGGASFLSGLTYDVTPLEYSIGGEYYTTPLATTVTTSSGDSSYDRIDLIIADIYGVVSILEGTPSSNPVQPDINESSQIVVALITVPVGAIAIIPIETIVYSNNSIGEWTATTNSATINLDYTGVTYSSSSKAIKYTLTPNTYWSLFNYNASFDTTTENTIQFRVYNTIAWTTAQRLNIKLYSSSGVQIGTTVQLYNGRFGFNSNLLSTWQTVSIPISAFSPSTALIGKLQFQSYVSSGVGLTVILDDIRMVVGPVVPSPTSNWWNIQGDTGTAVYPSGVNSTLRISGGTNINTIAQSTNMLKINLDDNISVNSISATTYYGITIPTVVEYWTSGSTGTGSIKANNATGLDATADYAVAEGYGTIASGENSHAEGNATIASGVESHAEGNTTIASGVASHAEGGGTYAIGDQCHSEGTGSIAGIRGFGTPKNTGLVNGLITLNTSYGDVTSAFTIGNVIIILGGQDSYYQLIVDVTFSSTTETQILIDSPITDGSALVVFDLNNYLDPSADTITGHNSHAEGNSQAFGSISHAEGGSTMALGSNSHTEGYYTKAVYRSHAEGDNTFASGRVSHAEGTGTIASGENSHAEGRYTTSSGYNSHAGGDTSVAGGISSFIHSTNSIVTGDRSVVLGGQNITGTTADTVYVPKLNIGTIGSGTSVNNLGLDSSGNVVTGTTSGGGSITGTGTTNNLSKWSSSTGLTDSTIVDDGTDIYVYTTEKLRRKTPYNFGTVTTGSTINWDLSVRGLNSVATLDGTGVTLSITAQTGDYGTIVMKQNAVGGYNITLPAGSIVSGGGGGFVYLSPTANAIDLLNFYYDGTNYFWSAGYDYN